MPSARKLTEEQIADVRALYAAGRISKAGLAARFGVSESVIRLAVNRDAMIASRRESYTRRLAENPAAVRTSQRKSSAKRRAEKPVAIMLGATRYRAKRDGVPCTITEEDITIPERCPYLGILLVVGRAVSASSPSIDKIIPSLGYVPGNVEVVSNKWNVMKQDTIASQHFIMGRRQLRAAWDVTRLAGGTPLDALLVMASHLDYHPQDT